MRGVCPDRSNGLSGSAVAAELGSRLPALRQNRWKNATSVILHLPKQEIWLHIWKHTMEKSQENTTSVFRLEQWIIRICSSGQTKIALDKYKHVQMILVVGLTWTKPTHERQSRDCYLAICYPYMLPIDTTYVKHTMFNIHATHTLPFANVDGYPAPSPLPYA